MSRQFSNLVGPETRYLGSLRKTLFGHAEPPFKDAEEAAQWLRAEHARGAGTDYADKLKRLEALEGMLFQQAQAHAVDFPPGWTIPIGKEAELVMFQHARRAGERSPVESVVATTELLSELGKFARTLAAVTGRYEHEATMQLLTGEPKPRPLPKRSQKDLAFFALIDELQPRLGRPPLTAGRGVHKGIRHYWQEFIKEWNAREDTRWLWEYESWTSVEKAYRRLRPELFR